MSVPSAVIFKDGAATMFRTPTLGVNMPAVAWNLGDGRASAANDTVLNIDTTINCVVTGVIRGDEDS